MKKNIRSKINKCYQFIRKDIINQTSYKALFLSHLLTALFYISILFYVSKIISPSNIEVGGMFGKDYFSFAFLGFSMFGFLMVGLNVFSRQVKHIQNLGTMEFMFSSTTSPLEIVVLSSMWDFFKSMFGFSVYVVVGVFLFDFSFDLTKLLPVLILVLLTLFSISALGIIAASFTIFFKQNFTYWVAAFLSLFSGVFFPVELVPANLSFISYLSPLTYSLDAIRGLLMGSFGFSEILPNIVVLLLFILILIPISVAIFNIFLNKARRDGNLGEY